MPKNASTFSDNKIHNAPDYASQSAGAIAAVCELMWSQIPHHLNRASFTYTDHITDTHTERGPAPLPASAHSQCWGMGFSKACATDNQWAEMLLTRVQSLSQAGKVASCSAFLKAAIPL